MIFEFGLAAARYWSILGCTQKLDCFIVRRYAEPLNQYTYLMELKERNERLFYKLLSENVGELMPIVYTPTVGLACQRFGYNFKRPQVTKTPCLQLLHLA